MAISHRVAEGAAMRAFRAGVLALAALGLGLGGAANAQAPSPRTAPSFPTKPVRMIVPFPPGGATDVIARMLSQKLIEAWGHPVVLDYKQIGSASCRET